MLIKNIRYADTKSANWFRLICQEDADDDFFAAAFARIECHYFVNGGFFDYDGQVIKEASKLNNIPGVIVQGRYDLVFIYH